MVQLNIGEAFAGYSIEGVLGQGGMGTVYLARHPRLPRSVALKLLNREISVDEELRRRFEQEATVVARLDHPGIVGVYDRGTYDGCLWIAMQYIRGSDAVALDPRTLTVERALRIITETAAALDYAHSRGVLHRDIKPANILLAEPESGREERAVLTDFGIARLLDSNTKLTTTGSMMATLAYASPEQLSAEPTDHRADQYSLACTLFTLLAGRSPFADTNPGQVVAAHLSKPVPQLSSFRPDLPPVLDGVIARAMAKQRDDRFASCGEFAAAAVDAVYHGVAARSAPTVVNRSAAPAPQYQYAAVPQPHYHAPMHRPVGPVMPPRPRKSKALLVSAMVVAVLMAIGGTVLVVERDNILRHLNGQVWDSQHQVIADAFPSLLASGNGLQGWLGAECHGNAIYQGKVPYIKCSDRDRGIEYEVRDFGNGDSATASVEESVSSRSGDRWATHSGSTSLLVTIDPSTFRSAKDIYTRFSEQRSRFVFVMSWANHTAAETLQEWWPQAPLGSGSQADAPVPLSTSSAAPSWCAPSTDKGKITGNGPGGTSTGPDVIFAYYYAYYVQHSGVQARTFVASESTTIPSANVLQNSIDVHPVGTVHCVEVTAVAADLYHVETTSRHPDGLQALTRGTIVTTALGGRTVIKDFTQ
ncbi:protein kinase [Nocardia sp. NBC_00565]|uniref:serine/threonine-protein kinase n=1 Tax=Nocardia sp. NBC_00565 TaxID=2975993 RepID=UPI002E80BE7B|nr:protein kinase [Nocardia sp. NBC_00565]WUC04113.1 protein kinase [Nocardia sp. NBC_00565]